MTKEQLIILGNGPAGLTAGIYAGRAGLSPLIFGGPVSGGQLTQTSDVENFPGFPDGIMGNELIEKMQQQAEKMGARFVSKTIDKVDFSREKELKIWSGEEEFVTKAIILATGAEAIWLNLGKNEERFWGKGYTACATCDGPFFRDKVVGVIGGGDSACEEAMFLTKFCKEVHIFVRRDEMRASKPMRDRVEKNDKITIIWNSSIDDLHGENLLEKVSVKNNKTGEISEMNLSGLFVAVGHRPNTKFLHEEIATDETGFAVVKDDTKTNKAGVFVAGDVSDHKYRQAIVAAGAGCKAAMDAEHFLAE
jgi:thioredoxin reductase (NADPH)